MQVKYPQNFQQYKPNLRRIEPARKDLENQPNPRRIKSARRNREGNQKVDQPSHRASQPLFADSKAKQTSHHITHNEAIRPKAAESQATQQQAETTTHTRKQRNVYAK